ncbi:MAG: MerR family transcriptional regulator [Bacteroidetes bacterium]|nr:MerR family transcriptional regulator [Bacteroidota bacterium]
MNKFSVKGLAELAGVSVRTLYHYDKLGLLQPAVRTDANYRYYGEQELLRLQQILLYKELDLSLSQIGAILDDPEFDILKAMQAHKEELLRRKKRIGQLLQTINSTIDHLKNKGKKMDYNELYKGFSKEQAEAWQQEAAERWGADTVANANNKAMAMNKGEWEALQQKGEDLNKELAEMIGLPATDSKVQAQIKEHYEMMGKYFDVTPNVYRCLSDMYVNDERFAAYYDKYNKGLAVFLRDAIHAFCDNAE